MAEQPQSDQPVDRFTETVEIPSNRAQTAIGITHNRQMTKVDVEFFRVGMDNRIARYEAVCPRCNEGRLEASVALNPDGSFADQPTYPTLCEACEDQLDAILEGLPSTRPTYEVANRVTLKTFTPRTKRG